MVRIGALRQVGIMPTRGRCLPRSYGIWSVVKVVTLFLMGVFIGIGMYIVGVLPDDISIRLQVELPTGQLVNPNSIGTRRISSHSAEMLVPNIVHYVWFGKDREFTFLNYLSVSSVYKIQQPDVLLFHCDYIPRGPWWNTTQQNVPIQVLYFEPPSEIHGQKMRIVYHQGDVAKIQILMKYGGIYLDSDVLVARSLDPLRYFAMTMGKEKPPKLNAGIILANRDSLFLKLWYESYRNNYKSLDWDYNCARVTYQLYLSVPNLLHVEPSRLTTPDWQDRDLLWNHVIEWRDLYIVHVMNHLNWAEYNPENIRTMNSTFGEVARFIYYGDSKLLSD